MNGRYWRGKARSTLSKYARGGMIGVHEPQFRSRCIKLGEALDLVEPKEL